MGGKGGLQAMEHGRGRLEAIRANVCKTRPSGEWPGGTGLVAVAVEVAKQPHYRQTSLVVAVALSSRRIINLTDVTQNNVAWLSVMMAAALVLILQLPAVRTPPPDITNFTFK